MIQHIFPSIMGQSQKEINALFAKLVGTAKVLHLDIADGKAVPNTSLWFPFHLSQKFTYQAHLMIKNPEQWIEKHGQKVDLCIPQFEETDVCCYIPWMKKLKRNVAFALRPETPVRGLQQFIQDVDVVLLLTVNPGFYGAKFRSAPLRKIKAIKSWNPQVKVIIDGGISPVTIKKAATAGADYFVSGSFVSKADEPKKALAILEHLLKNSNL